MSELLQSTPILAMVAAVSWRARLARGIRSASLTSLILSICSLAAAGFASFLRLEGHVLNELCSGLLLLTISCAALTFIVSLTHRTEPVHTALFIDQKIGSGEEISTAVSQIMAGNEATAMSRLQLYQASDRAARLDAAELAPIRLTVEASLGLLSVILLAFFCRSTIQTQQVTQTEAIPVFIASSAAPPTKISEPDGIKTSNISRFAADTHASPASRSSIGSKIARAIPLPPPQSFATRQSNVRQSTNAEGTAANNQAVRNPGSSNPGAGLSAQSQRQATNGSHGVTRSQNGLSQSAMPHPAAGLGGVNNGRSKPRDAGQLPKNQSAGQTKLGSTAGQGVAASAPATRSAQTQTASRVSGQGTSRVSGTAGGARQSTNSGISARNGAIHAPSVALSNEHPQTSISRSSRPVRLMLPISASNGRSQVVAGRRSDTAGNPTTHLPYGNLSRQFIRQAEGQESDERIPPSYRELVKGYFNALARPGK